MIVGLLVGCLKLCQIKKDNLRLPDYDGIEIKALLKKNHYDLTLFSIIPQLDNMSFDQKISYFFSYFLL